MNKIGVENSNYPRKELYIHVKVDKMGGAFNCVTVQKTASQEGFADNAASTTDLNETRRDLEQNKSQSCCERHMYRWMFGVDLPILFILLTVILLFELAVIPSHKAGFYCNDPALSFPFRGDTVSAGVLIASLLIGPLVIFVLTEVIFTDIIPMDLRRNQALRSAATVFQSYGLGLMLNFCVVEVMKGIMGAPRPTFFDLCEPDTAKTCNGTEFVPTFECTSTKYSWWLMMDSYRSFPSGHTSLSVYSAFFVAWYLQRRAFDWRYQASLPVPFVQLLAFSFAVVSSLTRITDHRHHWWDVLAGAVVGAVSLLCTIRYLCKYSQSSSKCEKLEKIVTG